MKLQLPKINDLWHGNWGVNHFIIDKILSIHDSNIIHGASIKDPTNRFTTSCKYFYHKIIFSKWRRSL